MDNFKNLLEEATSKLTVVVNDLEDLTISGNHKINILDVLEEIKNTRELIAEARVIYDKKEDRSFKAEVH